MAHLPRRKLPRGDGGVLIQIQSLEIAGYDTKVKDSSLLIQGCGSRKS